MSHLVFAFDAGHSREGTIHIKDDETCTMCGYQGRAIVIDQSEGEYKPAILCENCLRLLLQQLGR